MSMTRRDLLAAAVAPRAAQRLADGPAPPPRHTLYVGMEHGASSTPEHAMEVVRRVAGV
jgi:hypothetical protein